MKKENWDAEPKRKNSGRIEGQLEPEIFEKLERLAAAADRSVRWTVSRVVRLWVQDQKL